MSAGDGNRARMHLQALDEEHGTSFNYLDVMCTRLLALSLQENLHLRHVIFVSYCTAWNIDNNRTRTMKRLQYKGRVPLSVTAQRDYSDTKPRQRDCIHDCDLPRLSLLRHMTVDFLYDSFKTLFAVPLSCETCEPSIDIAFHIFKSSNHQAF